MNKGLLIGFAVIVAVFLGGPVAINMIRQQQAASAAQAAPAAQPGAPAATPAPAAAQPAPAPAYVPPPNPQAATMTAQDLIGTTWEVSPTPYGPAQVTFQPNGRASASVMGMSVSGSWQVQGNRIVAVISAMNQTQTVQVMIQGNTLVGQGVNIRRIR